MKRKWLWFALFPLSLLLLFVAAVVGFNQMMASRAGTVLVPTLPADPNPYDNGLLAFVAGEHERAIALLLQVPEDHRQYGRARRFVGWEIYTRTLHMPEAGLPYVNQAVFDEPFDGNSWQDLTRTYGRAFRSLGR